MWFMPLLVAAFALITSLLAVSRLIRAYDRRLMLFEYARRVQACPRCGRPTLAVRRRPGPDAPWGEWKSVCCGEQLEG